MYPSSGSWPLFLLQERKSIGVGVGIGIGVELIKTDTDTDSDTNPENSPGVTRISNPAVVLTFDFFLLTSGFWLPSHI